MLPCDILKKLSDDIDIPLLFSTNSQISILNRLIIKYSIEYSEMFTDNSDKKIKWIRKSDEFLGIIGLNSTSGANINLPDWEDIYPNKPIEKCENIRLFGCDNKKTFHTIKSGKDYLYLCLFDTSKLNTFSKILKGKVELLFSNGENYVINLTDQIIKNYSIVRIPTSLSVFEIKTLKNIKVIQYKITLWDSANVTETMERTYIIDEKKYYIHEFLFQNKYGVLEYFFVEDQKNEITLKADQIILNNINEININEKNKIFTVNTGVKTYHQLKIIAQAALTNHNYLIFKDSLIPIYINPETITLLDESKDLQDTVFKFIFKDDNTENIVVQNAFSIVAPVWQDEYDKYEYLGDDYPAEFVPATWDDKNKFNELKKEILWNLNQF
jgi:hypothetical protein